MPHDYRVGLLVVAALALAGVAGAIIYALASSSTWSSSNEVEGSGVLVSESRSVPAFRSLDLAGSNNVTIRVGEARSLSVHGDDNLIDRVTTEVAGSTLVIGNTPGSFTTRSPMRVDVTVPSLSELTLSGSGSITVTGIASPRLTVTIPGSGVIRAGGITEQLDVAVSGSGQAELQRLVASDVQAVVSGSGVIVVAATESLDAAVPGSGAIFYGGNPNSVTKSVTGSGAITST